MSSKKSKKILVGLFLLCLLHSNLIFGAQCKTLFLDEAAKRGFAQRISDFYSNSLQPLVQRKLQFQPKDLFNINDLAESELNVRIDQIEDFQYDYITTLREDQNYRSDGETKLSDYPAFIASNEIDWYRKQENYSESDLIFGAGTTMLWDLAVRSKAKSMVIADISTAPLLMHKFLFEPLFIEAQSIRDFLELLAGYKAPKKISTDKLFEWFEDTEALMLAKGPRYSAEKETFEFQKTVFKRLLSNPKINLKQISFIEAFYSYRRNSILQKLGRQLDTTLMLEPSVGRITFSPLSMIARRSEFLLNSDFGSAVNTSKNPFYSAFSSEASFKFVKNLFLSGNVYYFQGDLLKGGIYEQLNYFINNKQYKKIDINLSNVVDVTVLDQENKKASLVDLFSFYQESILPKGGQIRVHNTRGTNGIHNYEAYQFDKTTEISEVVNNGFTKFEEPSDGFSNPILHLFMQLFTPGQ